MKPWKTRYELSVILAPPQLQWGHGDEAVEDHAAAARLARGAEASMGPRR